MLSLWILACVASSFFREKHIWVAAGNPLWCGTSVNNLEVWYLYIDCLSPCILLSWLQRCRPSWSNLLHFCFYLCKHHRLVTPKPLTDLCAPYTVQGLNYQSWIPSMDTYTAELLAIYSVSRSSKQRGWNTTTSKGLVRSNVHTKDNRWGPGHPLPLWEKSLHLH